MDGPSPTDPNKSISSINLVSPHHSTSLTIQSPRLLNPNPSPSNVLPLSISSLTAEAPKVVVHDDPNATPKPKTPARRTYSITNDILIDPQDTEIKRLPRQGWQNNRAQAFRLDEEGDVSLKEQSPVRLPRAGQAPRREFSFSNLGEVYRAQEKPSKRGSHFEFDDEEVPPLPTRKIDLPKVDVLVPGEEAGKKASIGGGRRVETIFHDSDDTPEADHRPSIGGGTGGRRPEETIFVELEEDSLPPMERKKTPITRRDQQTHFTLTDQSTPVPVKKAVSSHIIEGTPPSGSDQPPARIPHTRPDQQTHFTLTDEPSTPAPLKKATYSHIIEGTPVANAEEYIARALQRKEMNHFRPDTVSHFDIVDDPGERMAPAPKKEKTESMEKLLNGISSHWSMTDSPAPVAGGRVGHVKKDLATHFSFGDSPGKNEEEKENGRGHRPKRYRFNPTQPPFVYYFADGVRMAVPVKSEEKEWWET